MDATLFAGCKPEVAAGPDGRIIGVGAGARAAAGRRAAVVRLRGEACPGLVDSHIHLESLAARRLNLDLAAARSLDDALARVSQWAEDLPADGWVIGSGWYNDAWSDASFPTRHHLDRAAGGRPVYLSRKDGHSAWVSSLALQRAKVGPATADPAGGLIDRDAGGEPTGILRETAMQIVAAKLPAPTDRELDGPMARTLGGLACMGVTAVHSMDRASTFRSLQRLHSKGRLKVRITYNMPVADLPHAERMGIRSGWGDPWLRIWGVKAFLDGSLGSRTAEMLDGSGTARMSDAELEDVAMRCARARLNVCWHAIGDRAVRRALDALTPHRDAWRFWRPRIEHAQCVNPKDALRFAKAGVIASMQPIHAVADRELADEYWPRVTAHAYAWGMLEQAGARLAFGSDAPVETADPLKGIEAATTWRKRSGWHPELAISKASALRAYTSGAAYAVGMEREAGSLTVGKLCDMTVVDGGRVVATVVGGRISWRKPA